MGAYVKKTARRRYDERQFTVRAVHRDPPGLHKLCEALIRLTLQEVSQARGHRGDQEALDAYRASSLPDARSRPSVTGSAGGTVTPRGPTSLTAVADSLTLEPARGVCETMAEEHEVLTTEEAAALLRVSTKTVLALAREGSLPGEKVGRAWRFLRSDVLAVVRGSKDTAKSVGD